MRVRRWTVAVLIGLYPPVWRREYGVELKDILVSCPLRPRIVADVVLSGVRERLRATDVSTILGLGSLLVILTGFVVTHGRYDHVGRALLRPSPKAFPTSVITLLPAEFYAVLLMFCGCWTRLRSGASVTRAGIAAVRMSLIGGLPFMLAGFLIALGLVDVIFLPPGDVVATASQHGLAQVRASSQGQVEVPVAFAMMISPLVRVPESWIWGAIGGQIGRWVTRA